MCRPKRRLNVDKGLIHETFAPRAREHQISVHALPPRELSVLGAPFDHFGRAFPQCGDEFRDRFFRRHLDRAARQEGEADTAKLRSIAEHLKVGDVEVQGFGGTSDVTMRFGLQPGGDVAQQAAVNRVKDAIGDGL